MKRIEFPVSKLSHAESSMGYLTFKFKEKLQFLYVEVEGYNTKVYTLVLDEFSTLSVVDEERLIDRFSSLGIPFVRK